MDKSQSRQIQIRLKSLKIALYEIRIAFQETKKDAFIEMGFEYDKPYRQTPEIKALNKKVESLRKEREDVLYYRIFCFSQVVYSLKDYLKKLKKEKWGLVESFFSDSFDEPFAKKDLANDLKHNPKNDMKYGYIVKDRKTVISNRNKTLYYNYDFNWNYRGLDIVDYCEKSFAEIHKFVRDEYDI